MSYPITTRGVSDALGSQRVVADEIEIGDVHLGEQLFTPVGPASFDVTLTYTGVGIVAAGKVSARFRTECVRCLQDYELDVTGDVEGFYVDAAHASGIPAEQEYEPLVDYGIDLQPALIQALVVELPFAPLHTPECAGICPRCGADLNEGPCGCEPEEPESPFAKLKDVLGEGAGSEGGGESL